MPVQDVGGGTMMGKANAVPYEDQAGMSEVQRKRLLMQQLLKESLSGGSGVVPDSGAIKVPDYAGAIGKVLQAYIGTKGAEAGAKEAADVAQKATETHRQEMQKFNTEAYGGPYGGYKLGAGQPEMAGPPRGPSEYTGMSQGNVVEALKNAVLSKDPQTRQFGQDLQKKNIELDLAGIIRDNDRLKAIQTGHFLPSTAGPGVDPSQYRPMPQIKEYGGVFSQQVPGESGTAVPPIAPAKYAPPSIDPTTGYPVQENLLSGEVKSLPGPTQVVASQSAAANMKQIETGFAKANAAVNTLQNVATIQDQLKNIDPSALGPFSDVRLLYNKVLRQIGGNEIPEGTAVERLNSELGERLMETVRAFAPVTEVDVKKAQGIAGSTGNGVEALKSMTDYVAELAGRTIMNQNKFVGLVEGKPGYENMDQWKVDFRVKGMPPTEAKPSQYESEVARMRGEAAQESGQPPPPLPENATVEQKRNYYLEEVRRKRKAGQ